MARPGSPALRYVKTSANNIAGQKAAWRSVVCSGDGRIVYATVAADYPYRSTDFGRNWYKQSTPAAFTYFDMSSDGTKLIGCTNSYIYTSTNSGQTWTTQAALGNKAWTWLAVSPNGQYMVGVANSSTGSLWFSSNSGASWSDRSITSITDLTCCDVIDTGLVLVGCTSASGRLMYSPSPTSVFYPVQTGYSYSTYQTIWLSATGATGYAGLMSGSGSATIYSTNFAATGLMQSPLAYTNTRAIAGSSDGSYMVMGGAGTGVYTWRAPGYASTLTLRPITTASRTWTGVASSNDGQTLYAVAANYQIYTSTDYGVTWTSC